MDYQSTLSYLYNSAPLFQQVGSAAYKEGLELPTRRDWKTPSSWTNTLDIRIAASAPST